MMSAFGKVSLWRKPEVVARAGTTVADRMTPLAQLVVHRGELDLDAAEKIMVERKVKKLPLVNPDGSHGYWHVSAARGRTNRCKDAQAVELGLAEYGVWNPSAGRWAIG